MNQLAPTPIAPEPVRVWPIIGGIAFILLWIATHVGLFYLIFAQGFILEIFLNIVRSVMVPGTADTPRPEMFSWAPAMQIALTLSGLSGTVGGLAFFWRPHRKRLLLGCGAGLLIAAVCGIYSFYLLFAAALSVP
jgi:hypothetical protein